MPGFGGAGRLMPLVMGVGGVGGTGVASVAEAAGLWTSTTLRRRVPAGVWTLDGQVAVTGAAVVAARTLVTGVMVTELTGVGGRCWAAVGCTCRSAPC